MRIKRLPKLAAIAAAIMLLTACKPLVTEDELAHQTVYASFYPIYAISDMILKDVPEMELRLLVQPQDGCLRSYSLSDWDLYQLAYAADMVIIAGRGLESFEAPLQQMGENGPAVFTMLQGFELDQNGIKSSDEDSGHLFDENPHLYMSVRALPDMLKGLCAGMTQLDPSFTEIYESNLKAALKEANALIAEYDEASEAIDHRIPVALLNETLIYPAKDLDLNVACRVDRENGADLTGTEWTEALEKLSETEAKVILIERQAPQALIERLKAEGYSVVLLNILSTGTEAMGGDGYLQAMRGNLAEIVNALKDTEETNE